ILGAQANRFGQRSLAVTLACAVPVVLVPLPFADDLGEMAALMVLAGFGATPMLALTYQIVGNVALSGTEAEAFAWPFTALLAGMSAGSALAGLVVELAGWQSGMLTAIAAGVSSALVVVARRRPLPEPTRAAAL